MSLRVLIGNCRESLRSLPSESVQCCVTSPPYWGLRDYGHADQIGQESTPEAFAQSMVEVFREVWRVLKPDGTLWLNLGDSYCGSAQGVGCKELTSKQASNYGANASQRSGKRPVTAKIEGIKTKDLVGIPWMVAFALRAEGWYLRQDIIWAKPNPMPESVTDRCTKSHEYLFLLTKSASYYYDAEAIQEEAAYDGRKDTVMKGLKKSAAGYAGEGKEHSHHTNGHERWKLNGEGERVRNKRSVWTVPTQGYSDAHFATFPATLITPCILAGTKPGDVVLDPFGGSGTTAKASLELGRKAVICELNPEYAKLIEHRATTTLGLGI